MSKSKRNVVDPEHIIESYGADTARWFMLSDTPPERDIEWTATGAEGAWRFIQRIWRLVGDVGTEPAVPTSADLKRAVHKAIAAVTDDLEGLRFNRAIARIYELTNAIQAAGSGGRREAVEVLVQLFAPIMPHLAEECWSLLGKKELIATTSWPPFDASLLRDDNVTLAIQVDGKRRDEITVAKGLGKEELESLVMAREAVIRALNGRSVKKFIVIPDRIINIVCTF
jgi:leucyl-tRNA synthetase